MGHEIAWDQFALPVSKPKAEPRPSTAALEVKDGDDTATITGKGFSVRFDKKAGVLTEYRYQGVTVLERGPRAGLLARAHQQRSRRVEGLPQSAGTNKSLDIELWREAGPRWDVKEVNVEKLDASTVKVTVRAACRWSARRTR